MPPRKEEQTFDVKIKPENGNIDHTSGGLSLFNTPNYGFGSDWWVIPAGTQLPPEFTLSKDLTDGKFRGHYTIRALLDMQPAVWKKTLADWADKHAVHIKEYKKVKYNV
jgi:hypothetical protein